MVGMGEGRLARVTAAGAICLAVAAGTSSALAQRVGDTRFEPDRGFHANAVTVSICSDTPGAYISYTTDGSVPLPSSGQPSPANVQVAQSTPLRALAYDPNAVLEPSNVDTHTYVILAAPLRWSGTSLGPSGSYPSNVVTSLKSLPALFVAMAPADFATVRDSGSGSIGGSGGNEQYERPCSVELHYPTGNPEFAGFSGFQEEAGLRPHSWVTTKRGFRLYFKRIYGAAKLRYPLFESAPWAGESAVEQFDKLVLRNHSNDGWEGRWGASSDALYLRDQFARSCQVDMGELGSRSMWVHLFVNGGYYGLYNPSERPDDDFQASYLGGSDDDYLGFNHGGTINDGADTTIKDAAYSPGDLSGSAAYNAYQPAMNVRQFSDYLISSWYNNTHSHDWPVNGDRPQNYYGGNRNNPPAPVRHFTWDFEAALVWDAAVHSKFRQSSTDKDEVFIRAWFALIDNGDFMSLFADRVYRHLYNDGALTPILSRRRLNAMAEHVRPALAAEDWQWGDPFGNWESRLANASAKIGTNPGQLVASLRSEGYYPGLDPPAFEHLGAAVASTRVLVSPGYALRLTNPNGGTGSIKYGLDGNDPRLAGGATAPTAVDGGDDTTVTLTHAAVVKARVLDGTEWSAVHELVVMLPRDFSALAITEIMYNPANRLMASNITVTAITGDAGGDDFGRARVTLGATPPATLTGGDWIRLTGAAVAGNNGEFEIDHVDAMDLYLERPLTDEPASTATAALYHDGDRYDFVEIKNTGSGELDLTGVTFSRGVRFAFPNGFRLPGGAFAVLANRPWDFTERYPAVTPAGEFLGCLANPGERLELAFSPPADAEVQGLGTDTNGISRIRLSAIPAGINAGDRVVLTAASNVVNIGSHKILDVQGNDLLVDTVFADEGTGARVRFLDVITSVQYDDRQPWPMPADGYGYSLVPTRPDPPAGQDDPTLWRASANLHGSPGTGDPEPGSRPPLLVTEALTHTDWPQVDAVEIHNPTASPVNLGGWWLTDDRSAPATFQLPSTNIPAGGHVVFYEDNDADTNNNASLPPHYFGGHFALSSAGEAIYLFAPNLSYSHGFAFDAAVNGITFGRHVNSLAEEHFVAQSSNSLGVSNTSPRVGPVVISEIMYHPEDGDHEFVEIKNISPSNVNLFNAQGEPWKVNGIGFQFPAGITMAPGEIILLVRDTITPAAFRTAYGVPAGTRIYAYAGRLDNGGETLTLRKPDLPNGVEIPWVAIDRVRYNDRTPWPLSPDGHGPSLERITEAAYGNDPVNWHASATADGTPGQSEPPTTPLVAVEPAGFVLSFQEDDNPTDKAIEIWNTGIDTLNYSVSETSSWLTVSPPLGTSEHALDRQQHTLSFQATNLAAGTHETTVLVTDPAAANSPAHVTVRLQVTERDRVPPLIHEVRSAGEAAVKVVFSETLLAVTATNNANYLLDGSAAVRSAILETDGRTVRIGTSALTPGQTYRLTVSNVEDVSGNAITPGTQVLFEQPDVLVPEGLIAYWKLDENTGTTAADATTNGHAAALTSGASWNAEGRFGSAVEFDGGDARLEAGTWSVGGSALTLTAWIKADDFGVGDARIISKATDHFEQDHYFMLSTVTDGPMKLRARLKTGGQTHTLIAASGALQAGTWAFVAMVYDGTTLKLFKDAAEAGSMTKNGMLDTNDSVPIWVGNNPGPRDHKKPFDGLIDDVRIYDRALDPQELQILRDATAPALPAVTAVAIDPSASEIAGQEGRFRLTRTTSLSADLGVRVAFGGTAVNGVDYEAITNRLVIPAGSTAMEVPLVPVDDHEAEGAEMATLEVQPDSDYVIGVPASATVTIADDDAPSGAAWFHTNLAYRLSLSAGVGSCTRSSRPAEATLRLDGALAAMGPGLAVDTNSFRLVETDGAGTTVDASVPFQFDVVTGFDSRTNAAGNLVWVLEGTSLPHATRSYHLYFTGNGTGISPAVFTPRIQVTDGVVDEGQESFRIGNEVGTWYYHKQGAGFASLDDTDGHDWIGYHPTGNEQGNYRGIPNLAVMHPGQALCTSVLEHSGPLKATWHSATSDGLWEGTWEMYPRYARFTLTKAADTWWLLYEGTPGGGVNGSNDLCVRSSGASTPLNQSWDGDIAGTNGTEWVYFADGPTERSLFLAHHGDNSITDTYWPMGGDAGMTVFGFGREAGSLDTFLSQVPARFTVGLVDARDANSVAAAIDCAVTAITVTLGGLEVYGDADGDGMTDAWEILYFGRTDAVDGGRWDDWDGDNLPNGNEERAGTDPTDAGDVLAITNIVARTANGIVLHWPSVSGRVYRIEAGSSLRQGLADVIAGGITAAPPSNVHTSALPSGSRRRYYRIRLETL